MDIGLTPKLVQRATKITVTRNEYGDLVYGAQTANIPCLYRDISLLSRRNSNREEIELDGLFWLDKDQTVNKGDLYLLDGEYLRIERVIKARRRVADNALMFYKCEVTKQRQIS